MDLKNLNIFNMPKVKSKLCALALAGTLMVTSLTGCSGGSKTNDAGENISSKDSMLLDAGNIIYSLQISGMTRGSSGWIEVTLADGSKVSTNERNVISYDGNSEMMRNVLEQENVVAVDTIQPDGNVKGQDTIMLFVEDEVHLLQTSGMTRGSSGWIEVTLADGSKISTNEMNVIAFNSNSKMMEQVTREKGQSKVLVP